jgi:hypothetical protein
VPENYTTVTYELREAGAGTGLVVTQENNSDQAMVNESETIWAMILQ